MAVVVSSPPVGNRDFGSFTLGFGAYLYGSCKRIAKDMKESAILPVIFHVCLFLALQITYNVVIHHWKASPSTTDTTTSCRNKKLSKLSSLQSLREGSSVWCTGANKNERVCKFKNLCYHPVHEEYMFFHGVNSVLDGIPKDRFNPALLDLSSVEDHNAQYFNYIDFPAHSLDSFQNITIFDGSNFIFHRFNSDNIMHVIHDDLLPLFHTMKQYSTTGPLPIDLDSRLVLMEGWDPGPYFELYQLFSSKQLLLKRDLITNDSLKCFQNAIVGISKYTTWYQYGFEQHQGPLPDIPLTGIQVREFTKFIKERLDINVTMQNTLSPLQIAFCSRHRNRLILNEANVSFAIATKVNRTVATVSFETHTIRDMIKTIGKSSGLVAVHGSVLVMAMFLPQGSFVMELFPFGINPDHYQPYKTLASLPGINLVYVSWRNTIEGNTVTHPNYDPELGGIEHLDKREQELIQQTKDVPPHLCCRDPYWLFRIYQDTIIDEASFLNVMETAIERSDRLISQGFQTLNELLLPGKVLNVTCVRSEVHITQPALLVSWTPPINARYFQNIPVQYEVWIQKETENDYLAFILSQTEHVFTTGLDKNTKYLIWVRCLANEMVGPFGNMGSCATTD